MMEKENRGKNINAYLIDAPDVFIESRQHPICDVPEIGIGNKPIDGGNYLFGKEEMDEFIKKEPAFCSILPTYGMEPKNLSIRNHVIACGLVIVHLQNCVKMPHCLKRIEAVREIRLESQSAGTRKLADTPYAFSCREYAQGNYIIVPKVSSEKRRYVPMGFMSPDDMASDACFIIPDATLYHFGILESNIHMAWMRAVCGRLKSDYRYSKDVVYNNFPWPNPTDEQKAKIEQTAQAILDARAKIPRLKLADMKQGNKMYLFPELFAAHQQNDSAVMKAYGFPVKREFTESHCVAELFKLYQELTKQK